MWVASIKSSSSVELEIKKTALNFFSVEELSRIELLCEHGIFGLILFLFSVIFLPIKIFFNKISSENYIPPTK